MVFPGNWNQVNGHKEFDFVCITASSFAQNKTQHTDSDLNIAPWKQKGGKNLAKKFLKNFIFWGADKTAIKIQTQLILMRICSRKNATHVHAESNASPPLREFSFFCFVFGLLQMDPRVARIIHWPVWNPLFGEEFTA